MRFELTTPTLARLCSTPELRPLELGVLGRPSRGGRMIAIQSGFARPNSPVRTGFMIKYPAGYGNLPRAADMEGMTRRTGQRAGTVMQCEFLGK